MSEPALTEDQKCALALGMNPEFVGQIRNRFYDNQDAPVLLWLFENRIEVLLAERRRKLESVKPEELQKLQGEITGLKLGASIFQRNQ